MVCYNVLGGIYGTESDDWRHILRFEAVARPYRWNKIPNLGGRTLIGGTGYGIKLKTSPTWYLNDSLGYNTLERTNVGFTANGEHFDQIVAFSMMGGVLLTFIVTSPATSVTPYDRGWTQAAYRTVTFDEEPTGALLTWLDANGTRQ